eukprot:scaffold13379_cov212-Isochrysis_galbana.AAC.1
MSLQPRLHPSRSSPAFMLTRKCSSTPVIASPPPKQSSGALLLPGVVPPRPTDCPTAHSVAPHCAEEEPGRPVAPAGRACPRPGPMEPSLPSGRMRAFAGRA